MGRLTTAPFKSNSKNQAVAMLPLYYLGIVDEEVNVAAQVRQRPVLAAVNLGLDLD